MRELYSEIEAYNTGLLKVSDIHTIYYEESGNPQGIPVVHLHGGPGSGSSPKNRQNYNPDKYRIIVFDQRGCGKSTPQGELEENTTPHLVEDMEKLRQHLNIENWVISGRSWGSTLATLYAETYPEKVKALFIGGVFLAEKEKAEWTEQPNGAAAFFPDLYAPYRNFIPPAEQHDMPLAYFKRLTSNDYELRKQAALTHLTWEAGIMKMEFRKKEDELEKINNPPAEETETDYDFLITLSKMLTYYSINNFFIKEGEILKNANKLKDIPGIIIQSRYDMLCPVKSAWQLHKVWNKSKLIIVPDCGHSSSEPPTINEIIKATDEIATWFTK